MFWHSIDGSVFLYLQFERYLIAFVQVRPKTYKIKSCGPRDFEIDHVWYENVRGDLADLGDHRKSRNLFNTYNFS